MAQAVTVQEDPQHLATDDPDYISPEDLAAQEAAKTADEDAERAKLEAEAKEAEAQQKKQRSLENAEAELRRLREQRDHLRESEQQKESELRRLMEENAAFKARQEYIQEQQRIAADQRRLASRPDPETDPYGAELWDLKEKIRRQEEIEAQRIEREQQWQAQQVQQNEAARTYTEVNNYLTADVGSWKAQHPELNYDEAARKVSEAYKRVYMDAGMNDQEATAMLAQQIYGIGLTARMRNSSAAQAIYNIATMMGYKPNGNSKAEGVITAPNAAEKIKTLQKAQSLQGIGGKKPAQANPLDNIANMSKEDLAQMSDDDYLRMKADPATARLLNAKLEELG